MNGTSTIRINSEPPKHTTFEDLGYVQVVRCKDCIYGEHEKDESTGREWICCAHHKESRPKEWYCASGSSTINQRTVCPEIEGDRHTWFYVCGDCHGQVNWHDAVCQHCKARLNWNG